MEFNATNISIIAGAAAVVVVFLLCFWWWSGRDDDEEGDGDVEQQRPGLHMVEDESNVGVWQQGTGTKSQRQKLTNPSGAGHSDSEYPDDLPNSPLKCPYNNLRRVSIPRAKKIQLKIGSIPE